MLEARMPSKVEKSSIVDPMGPSEMILARKKAVELRHEGLSKARHDKAKLEKIRQRNQKCLDYFRTFSNHYFKDNGVFHELSSQEIKTLAKFLYTRALRYACGWTAFLASSLTGIFLLPNMTMSISGLLLWACVIPYVLFQRKCYHADTFCDRVHGPIAAIFSTNHDGCHIDYRLKYLFRKKEADTALKESLAEGSSENG